MKWMFIGVSLFKPYNIYVTHIVSLQPETWMSIFYISGQGWKQWSHQSCWAAVRHMQTETSLVVKTTLSSPKSPEFWPYAAVFYQIWKQYWDIEVQPVQHHVLFWVQIHSYFFFTDKSSVLFSYPTNCHQSETGQESEDDFAKSNSMLQNRFNVHTCEQSRELDELVSTQLLGPLCW